MLKKKTRWSIYLLFHDFGFDHVTVEQDQTEWVVVTWRCVPPMDIQEKICDIK